MPKKSGVMEDLTENIITRMIARGMSIVGVPIAGFLLWQVYSDVQTAAAKIPLIEQRLQVVERNSEIQDLKAKVDRLENRLYYMSRNPSTNARPEERGVNR